MSWSVCGTPCLSRQRAVTGSRARAAHVVRCSPKSADTEGKKSSAYFPEIVSSMLWNATTLLQRGKASCAVCKTRGLVTCPRCGGTRVVSSKLNAAKAAAQARIARYYKEGGTHDPEWRLTNRCTFCKGAGVVDCPECHGAGTLT